MPIQQSDDGRAWFLSTRSTLYAVAIDSEGLPAQVYWGPALADADRHALVKSVRPRWFASSSRPIEIEEEVLLDGGLRWGVSGLSVEFPGLDSGPELRFTSAVIREESDSDTLAIALVDKLFPLTVTLHYRVRADTDVVERWLELDYGFGASGDLVVRRADSANWFIPDQDGYRYSSVHGHWGSESQLERGPLPHGELVFTSRTGTTGHDSNPWIMIDDGSSTEQRGFVRTVALGWSGSWRIVTQHRGEGGVSVAAGAGHDGPSRLLAPGATITTPSSFALLSDGGFGGASRAWHSFTRNHVLPAATEIRPVLYNSWEATGFDVTERGQKALANIAARIGAELFVVDDGWFGARSSDSAGLGDWFPSPKNFPRGLDSFVGHIRKRGMQFGIWVEPEMVNKDSELYRAYPDWVLHIPGRVRRERRHQLVLNFARADVHDWALDWLDKLVAKYAVDFLKWDMNRSFSQAGWPENAADQGSLWFAHTEAIYDIMATLRQRHPTLRIESCSGGGGRVDLGIMRFVDQLWTSDNTDARDRQPIQHGFSQLYPSISMTNWVTDSPNPMTTREIPLEYRFHVAMAGTLGIGGDLAKWSEAELAEASAHIATYKSVREVVQHGELFRLGGTPGHEFSALEYVLDDRVVVLSYEPNRSLNDGRRRFALEGLDSNAHYGDEASGASFSGAFLMAQGLELHPQANTKESNGSLRFSNRDYLSAIVTLRRAS